MSVRKSVLMMLIVGLIVACHVPAFGEEGKPARYWYRLEIQTGDSTYQCIGSTPLTEKDLAHQLSGTEYIVLDDAAYIDPSGKIKGWQEWDPRATPRLYVNPEYVLFFNPLKDDPRKAAGRNK